MVFDLLPYIPLMGEESRKSLSTHLQSKVSALTDPVRQARASLSLHKLNKLLGLLTYSESTLHLLQEEYLRALDLDGKPEKGERKLADDLVILIDELMETLDTHKAVI